MVKTPFPSDAADKYVVRFPEGMRERIAEAAKASKRSMNAEIIARLQGSFDPQFSEIARAEADIGAAKTRFELEFARRQGVELAYSVKSLLAALRELSPDGLEPPGLLEKMEERADEALSYEEKLDVRKYVVEMKRSMERALERAQRYLEHAENMQAPNIVIIPAEPAPPASKGPVRSPNARKPRP